MDMFLWWMDISKKKKGQDAKKTILELDVREFKIPQRI